MRKVVLAALAAVLLVLAVSCGTTKEMKYTYDVLDASVVEKYGLDLPYEEDAAALAKKNGEMRIYFLSSEKQTIVPGSEFADRWGDGAILFFPNGEVMMIDSAKSQFATQVLTALENLNVTKIDYYVQTHLHSDHYGALPYVLASHEVGKVYWNGCSSTTAVYEKFMSWVSGIPTEVLKDGDSLDIGEVHIDIFNPTDDVVGNYELGTIDETLNNTSMGMIFTYGTFKALFAADLYIAAEEDVIERYQDDPSIFEGITLLKFNHHGRTTSNSKKWAEFTQPVIAVCTRGEGIDTGAYQAYARFGTHCFGDYTDGFIRVVSDGESYTVTTCSRERATNGYSGYDKIAATVKPELWEESN